MHAYGRRPRSQSRGRRASLGHTYSARPPLDPFQYLDPVPPPPPVPGQFPEDRGHASDYYIDKAAHRARSRSRRRQNSHGSYHIIDTSYNDVPPPPPPPPAGVKHYTPPHPAPDHSRQPSIWRRFSSFVYPGHSEPAVAPAPPPPPPAPVPPPDRGRKPSRRQSFQNNRQYSPSCSSCSRSPPPLPRPRRSQSLKRPSSRTRRAVTDPYSQARHKPGKPLNVVPPPPPATAPKPNGSGGGGGGWKLPSLPAMPSLPMPSIPHIPLPNIPLPSIPLPKFPARAPRPPSPPPQLSPNAARFIYMLASIAELHNEDPMNPARTVWARKQLEGLMTTLEDTDVKSVRNVLVWVKRESYALGKEGGGRGAEKVGVGGKGVDVVERLARLLEGGYMAPGAWVEEDERWVK